MHPSETAFDTDSVSDGDLLRVRGENPRTVGGDRDGSGAIAGHSRAEDTNCGWADR